MRLACVALVYGYAVLTLAGSAWCGELVTAEEAEVSQSAILMRTVDETPANPLGPVIAVADSEALAQPVKNPFSIEILMQAQRDAEVNFATFKAFYGAFKVDITDRLLKEASKTLTGLKIAHVQIPPGRHKILLRVSDTKGRTTEKEIAFKVE